jgi:serine/threonine protein kinase
MYKKMEQVIEDVPLRSGSYGGVYDPSPDYQQYLEQYVKHHHHPIGGSFLVKKSFIKGLSLPRVYDELYFQTHLSSLISTGIVPILHWMCLLYYKDTRNYGYIDSHILRHLPLQENEEIPSLGKYRLWIHPHFTPMQHLAYFKQHSLRYGCEGVLFAMPKYDGHLLDYMELRYPLKDDVHCMISVMTILQQIHALNIVHGDVHLGNVLYKNNQGKIEFAFSDFGLTHLESDVGNVGESKSGDIHGFRNHIFSKFFYEIIVGPPSPLNEVVLNIYDLMNEDDVTAEEVVVELRQLYEYVVYEM